MVGVDKESPSVQANWFHINLLPNMRRTAMSGRWPSFKPFRLLLPERLLIQAPEQVERLDAHVGSMYTTLQQAPEVLQAIRVDFARAYSTAWSTTSC